jgi:hypothetical protein
VRREVRALHGDSLRSPLRLQAGARDGLLPRPKLRRPLPDMHRRS